MKLCPFCGGSADHYSHDNRESEYAGWLQHDVDHWVACNDCGNQTCMHPNEDEARAAWNKRVQR